MRDCIVVSTFILFDILTGLIKALYQHKLNSTYLREGLFHKLSEIMAVLGSWGIEYALNYISLGIDLPVRSTVTVYICVMELVSIIENIAEINPKLRKLFKPYLEKLNKTDITNNDNKGDENE